MGKAAPDKVKTKAEALDQFKDGSSVMVGGFNKVGVPGTLLRWLSESPAKELTLICNNCSNAEGGIWYPAASMIKAGRIPTVRISYLATNTDLRPMWEAGELELEIIPQGTLAERIRAGAFGIGGFLTKVGIHTQISEGKPIIEVDGEEYFLEKPLKADIALVKATKADKMGNAICHGTSKNFNTIMAPAARFTILEADKIVEVGQLNFDHIDIPSIFVDMVVQSEKGT